MNEQRTMDVDRRRLEELERENEELRRRLHIADELLQLQGRKLMKPRKQRILFAKDN